MFAKIARSMATYLNMGPYKIENQLADAFLLVLKQGRQNVFVEKRLAYRIDKTGVDTVSEQAIRIGVLSAQFLNKEEFDLEVLCKSLEESPEVASVLREMKPMENRVVFVGPGLLRGDLPHSFAVIDCVRHPHRRLTA